MRVRAVSARGSSCSVASGRVLDILRTAAIGITYTLIVGSYFLLLLIYALGMMITGFVGHLYLDTQTARKA